MVLFETTERGFVSHNYLGTKEFVWKVILVANVRGSHRRCSVKEGILKHFAKFARKHLRRSIFFNNVAGFRTFQVNFAKFSRTPFLKNSSGRPLLECLRSMYFSLLLLTDNARYYGSHSYLGMYLTKNYGNAATQTKCITKR